MNVKMTVFEMIIGVFSIIAGLLLSVKVWNEGYFVGAFMLVITGFLSILLALKDLKNPGDRTHWFSVLTTLLRRSFLFLNLMLSTLVIGVLTRLISFSDEITSLKKFFLLSS